MAGKRSFRQAGFTLVELMVGMALGLFILVALLALLVNVNRGNTELSKTNRMIENGRLSIQLLQSDVSHAGFWGGFTPQFDDLTSSAIPTLASAGGQVPSALPDPCAPNWADAAYKANVIGIPVASYQVDGAFSRTVAGTAPVCAGIVTDPVTATDVLVVRHAEPCVAGSGTDDCAAVPTPAADVYFQSTRCATDTTPYQLETAPAGTATFTLTQRNCTDRAPVYKLASTVYYVKLVNGVPTLMMSRIANGTQGAAQPLIENVEAFVVEFGIDTASDTGAAADFTAAVNWVGTGYTSPANRGDGNADSYIRCTFTTPCTPDQLMNAVSVKLHVLVRSEETTAGHVDANTYTLGTTANALVLGAANDAYRRQLFTQTIRLPNVSGRRETP
jgi:type IV pilus assembly protein PilW